MTAYLHVGQTQDTSDLAAEAAPDTSALAQHPTTQHEGNIQPMSDGIREPNIATIKETDYLKESVKETTPEVPQENTTINVHESAQDKQKLGTGPKPEKVPDVAAISPERIQAPLEPSPLHVIENVNEEVF